MARAKSQKRNIAARAAARATASSPAKRPATSQASMPVMGTASELRVLGVTRRTWPDEWEILKQYDIAAASIKTRMAAKILGAPAVRADLLPVLVKQVAQLTDIEIAFEAGQTKYNWGNFLPAVNASPYSAYFVTTQASASIIEKGIEWSAPSSANPAGWGNIVFNILDITCSSRFGGSVCVVLTPKEDCGIELLNGDKNIAVDLKHWLLRLYVRPNVALFNTPPPLQSALLTAALSCDIEVNDSEAYEVSSSGHLIANSPNVAEGDVQAMIRQAEENARGRLDKLARFVLGWVHQFNIPNFNRTVERVVRLHVSDDTCSFEINPKTPLIAVQLKIGYSLSSEGAFDDDQELTAQPWMIGRTPPLVVFNFRKSKYIGGAFDTGWMTMGFLTPTDLVSVREITVFPEWREDDPISDDTGGAVGSVFTVLFDAATVNQRVAAQQPGQIGEHLYAIADDPPRDWTHYFLEIQFELVWR
jgi:hypothetical protein